MKIRIVAVAILVAALAAACAPQEPATTTLKATDIEFAKIYSVVLNDRSIPPGGTVTKSASGWSVHGIMDGAAWRYVENEPFILVAHRPGIDWADLHARNEWIVSCSVPEGDDLQCSISRVRSKGRELRGLSMRDGEVCVSGGRFLEPAELMIEGGETHRASESPACFSPAESAAILRSLGAADTFEVRDLSPAGGQAATESFTTHGLEQALALSDWIRQRYAAGELEAQEGF